MTKVKSGNTGIDSVPLILIDYIIYAVFIAFSVWVMFKTFSYNHETGIILISNKIWSDFAANLPLIRSFSLGENWPPEYPIFPGEPIRYHFLFYYIVGKLESLGLPIDWALNLPSALGFALLLSMIYAIGLRLFRDRRIALLSVIFFILNGSLSFFQFFDRFPLLLSAVSAIFTTTDFSAMGPWDGGKVLGVWHLNVFINQRHFSVALGLLLAFIFVCLWLQNQERRIHIISAIFFGLILGLMPLFHKPVTLIFAVTMIVFFLSISYLRFFLFLMGTIAVGIMGLLMLLSLNIAGPANSGIVWHPGFTLHGTQEITAVITFLWFQFGLHCLLIPIGMILVPIRTRIFMIPAIISFVIAFTLRFSPDVMANHKFINFSLIMLQMLSAYVLMAAYDYAKAGLKSHESALRGSGKYLASAGVGIFILFMTLSGIIDLFAVANSYSAGIGDIKADAKARWFHENTAKDSLVLNSSLLYHPASIAGRKVFIGWPYFTTTAGYDHDKRFNIVKMIYASKDPAIFCPLLREHKIAYVTVQDTSHDNDFPPMDPEYFRSHFKPAYLSPDGWAVYSVSELCGAGATLDSSRARIRQQSSDSPGKAQQAPAIQGRPLERSAHPGSDRTAQTTHYLLP